MIAIIKTKYNEVVPSTLESCHAKRTRTKDVTKEEAYEYISHSFFIVHP
jgi:hypothetical protein